MNKEQLNQKLLNATEKKNIQKIKVLIEKGADVNAALMFAVNVQCPFINIVKLLIEKGADINTKNEYGSTALITAALESSVDIVKFLIEKGADVNAKNNDGNTALIYAAGSCFTVDILKLLIEKGADVNIKNKKGLSALMSATKEGYIKKVKILIEKGAHINNKDKDKDGNTLLILAAKSGKKDSLALAKLLIERDADVNAKSKSGRTVLMYVAETGSVDIVKLLIEKGADVNVKSKSGRTALMFAAWEGYFDIVELLIEKGADAKAKDDRDWTALMIAAQSGSLDIVKLFIEKGVHVNAKNKYFETALMIAAWSDFFDIVKFLIEKGADVNVRNKKGMTCLTYSVRNGFDDIEKFLIEKGAEIPSFEEMWSIEDKYLSQPAVNPIKLLPGELTDTTKIANIQKIWNEFIQSSGTAFKISRKSESAEEHNCSKYGGTPLYPKSKLKDWPVCTECGSKMVLKYQLRQKDVHALLCPKNTDMLLVFWCPKECGCEEVEHAVIWQKESDITDPIKKSPQKSLKSKKLAFTQVVDYPHVQEYGDGNFDWLDLGISECKVEIAGEQIDFLDACEHYNHRGEKVGGFPEWVQFGRQCCGQSLHLILQTEWAEGYWYILGCTICGEISTEYQGT